MRLPNGAGPVSRLLLAGAFLLAGGCGDSSPEKPSAPGTKEAAPPAAAQPMAPLVPRKEAADWCGPHGVPESACTRCNEDLIPEFKKRGDWCEKHSLPKSQCVACDPSLEAKLKAMAPK